MMQRFVSTLKVRTRYTLLLFLAGVAFQSAFAPLARAQNLLGPALESPVGRYLLGTPEAELLIARILGRPSGTVDDVLAHLKNPELKPIYDDLEAQIARVRAEFHEAQVARNGGRETPEAREFSMDERFVLREVAAKKFKIDTTMHPVDPRAGEIDFAGKGAAETSKAAEKARFLKGDGVADELGIPETPGDQAPVRIQESSRLSLREWYKESRACIKNRPQAVNQKADMTNLIHQMVIAGSVTTLGTVVRTGVAHIDPSSFSVDLLMSFVSTGVSMGLMKSTDTFFVRWLKVFGWGFGRTKLDAAVYYYSPWTNTHGIPLEEATDERTNFNYAWNAKTSWVSPLVFTILDGAQCMAAREGAATFARVARNAFAIKTGVAITNSIVYFQVRSNSLKVGN